MTTAPARVPSPNEIFVREILAEVFGTGSIIPQTASIKRGLYLIPQHKDDFKIENFSEERDVLTILQNAGKIKMEEVA